VVGSEAISTTGTKTSITRVLGILAFGERIKSPCPKIHLGKNEATNTGERGGKLVKRIEKTSEGDRAGNGYQEKKRKRTFVPILEKNF